MLTVFRYAISPIMFAFAYASFVLPPPFCEVPGPYGFLVSMWLMYVVMGVAHLEPWFRLFGRLVTRPVLDDASEGAGR